LPHNKIFKNNNDVKQEWLTPVSTAMTDFKWELNEFSELVEIVYFF
jgi:hypothetical protein